MRVVDRAIPRPCFAPIYPTHETPHPPAARPRLLPPAGRSPAQSPAPAPHHADASAPIAKKDDGAFLKKHEAFLARARSGPIGLLFLGDSITEGWTKAPTLWQERYGRYQPANFGIGGDTTQNVIWRIEHGELDGIQPRVVVLLLGTNNSASHTAAEIAAADAKIVHEIRTRIPAAKVLLLAIFPRGPRANRDGSRDDGVHRMEVIRATNALLAKLDDGHNVRFLDLSARFLGPDGKIPDAIMPEQLHPNAAGYQIWADGMQPLLDEMLR